VLHHQTQTQPVCFDVVVAVDAAGVVVVVVEPQLQNSWSVPELE